MIAYVKGELVQKQIGYVVIDVGGLGYKIFMSEPSIDEIGNIGDTVKVHTYYKVSEDDISLFGFNSQEELRMFELLISVSGIGAKTAIAMLACIEPSQFAIAVISDDIDTLKKIPGVGPKSAQRIVLELKDKMKKEQQITELTNATSEQKSKVKKIIVTDSKVQEAIDALQVLGYTRKDVEKALERINTAELTVEDIIKQALRELSIR
ncbi:MAG: Holliday junction branch migration protein RuvA [Clostridia bacterium]|nr:Holliday junction branch migration protein RuvA [Clostridia bacterium]